MVLVLIKIGICIGIHSIFVMRSTNFDKTNRQQDQATTRPNHDRQTDQTTGPNITICIIIYVFVSVHISKWTKLGNYIRYRIIIGSLVHFDFQSVDQDVLVVVEYVLSYPSFNTNNM